MLRLASAGTLGRGLLDSVSSSDTDMSLSVSLDKAQTGGGTYLWIIGRSVGSMFYSARMRFMSDGQVNVALLRGGTYLASTNVSGLLTPGEPMSVRLQVVGTSPTDLCVKVWPKGDTEPSDWVLQASDSDAGMQSAGSVGVQAYLSGSATNAPVTLSVDDLSARSSVAVPNRAPTAAFTSGVTDLSVAVDARYVVGS